MNEADTSLNSGAYQIIFSLKSTKRIKIGRMGEFIFPKGFYIYTGSAMKNLRQRIERHKRKSKNKHWHIDFLLPFSKISEIKLFPSNKREECKINSETLKINGAEIVVQGFGSSDCHCPAHLIYFNSLPYFR